MENVLKRGNQYHYSATVGNGRRLRASLGTSCPKSAKRLAHRIGLAIASGPDSELWPTLRLTLPTQSYRTIATGMSVTAPPDLAEFESLFKEKLDRREKLGEITASTHALYEAAADSFFNWLIGQKIGQISEVTPSLVEKYQVWRKERVSERPQSKNGRSLLTDNTVLAAIFELAQEERLIQKSPFKGRFRAYGAPKGAEPFTPEEMAKLEAATTDGDRLAFKIFKWTGMRGSDVADLTWAALDHIGRTLRWETRKRGVWVTIPISEALADQLGARWYNSTVVVEDKVLSGMTRPKLYRMIKELGIRAGVPNCHPHRFRDTLAVTLLERGATIYDVAKMLGDSVTTVEKHYAPFTGRLQERVRGILDSSREFMEFRTTG